MINNKVNFYQLPTLSNISADVDLSRVDERDRFVSASCTKGRDLWSRSSSFINNRRGLKTVFDFLNLLRFNHGAQFFKFEMTFSVKSPIFERNINGFFTTSGMNSINNRENIPLWQKKIRECVDSQLLERLNGFELLEFFYFNVVDVKLDDVSVCFDLGEKYGYWFLVRLDVFLVSRSIIGADCLDKFNEILCRPEKNTESRGPSTLKSLNFEEANEFLCKLMGFVPIKYKDLDLDLSRMLFHGFYCFRDLRIDYNDNDKFHKQTAGNYGEFSQKFLYLYGELFGCGGMSLGPLTYHRYPYEPFLYLNNLEEEGSFLGPNHIRHKHADIFGLNVESTYDSPSVLLNLIRAYCILNKIKFIDGQIFKMINNSFLKPLGSLSWFKFNIFNILDELAEEFPVSISVIDKPHIVSKQLNNVIALIELDSNVLFKEPATF